MYIGLFADGDTTKKVTSLCLEALELAHTAFPDDAQIAKDITKIKEQSKRDWALTPDPHITTLYLGHKAPATPEKQAIFTSFPAGAKFEFDVLAVAYLPGQILTGVTKIDRSQIGCDNQYDHMTLMTGTLTAKYSNDLLEQIFTSADYVQERDTSFAGVAKGRTVRVEVNVQKKKQTAYLVTPLASLHVHAAAVKKY